jgi:GDP-L-fucose synthase
MRILITGANGYIGKSLTNALKNKHEVTPLTRQSVDLTVYDDVKNFFEGRVFDVVIHCAIEGGYRLKEDSPDVIDNNLKMYYNLLDFQNHYGKLFHFGSGAEKQDTFYGLSKKVINQSIQNKPKFHNVRIFAVFDENENSSRFVKTNICNYIDRRDMNVFTNKYMDFFYMEDFITLIKHCILQDNLPKVIECCYDYKTTLYDIAEIINGLDNHKVKINLTSNIFDEPFNGKFVDMGLEFIGLEQGIKNVYNKLKK